MKYDKPSVRVNITKKAYTTRNVLVVTSNYGSIFDIPSTSIMTLSGVPIITLSGIYLTTL